MKLELVFPYIPQTGFLVSIITLAYMTGVVTVPPARDPVRTITYNRSEYQSVVYTEYGVVDEVSL